MGKKRELISREEGQEYAQVTRLPGNSNIECKCADGVNRLCRIRGSMRRRMGTNRMNPGDIILVSLREFGSDKGDVIHKYTSDEAFELQEKEEIPSKWKLN